MENWGLVTYVEYNLLYNEARKEMIATIVAHELSHMVSDASFLQDYLRKSV